MKITDKTFLQQLTRTDQTSKDQANGNDFAQTLSKAEAGASQSAATGSPGQVAGPAMTSPLGGVMAVQTASAAGLLEKSLGLLDQYARALGDESQNLKNIDGLVGQLDDQAGKLSGLRNSLPEGDGLRQLMDQTAVLISVETAKFKRGDYV